MSNPHTPLLENRSQYELDDALRCPYYIAARIRVKSSVRATSERKRQPTVTTASDSFAWH
jgi:hypothetical protein